MHKGTFEIELRMAGLSPEDQLKVANALNMALTSRWFNQHEEFTRIDNGRWWIQLVNSDTEVAVELRVFKIEQTSDA